MIGGRRYAIPFARDGSVRFLPWLIALMVYLAGLALAGTLLLNAALQDWSRGLAGVMTVELPPAVDDAKGDAGVTPVLDLLRRTPGVLSARPLERGEVEKLVEPWLGGGAALDGLALPRLVDLRIDPEHRPDLDALQSRLATAVPGAALDDSRRSLDRLFDLGLSVELTALAIVVLIGLAAFLTVVFTTRAGLAVHRNVIEILHILGAQDSYIARQFGRQALAMALRGGALGFALAVVTLLGIGHAALGASLIGEEIPQVRLLPRIALEPWHWGALALLPLAAALIARYTAIATVSRALARMP